MRAQIAQPIIASRPFLGQMPAQPINFSCAPLFWAKLIVELLADFIGSRVPSAEDSRGQMKPLQSKQRLIILVPLKKGEWTKDPLLEHVYQGGDRGRPMHSRVRI